MKLLGKRYTPRDNSYIANIKELDSNRHISLYDCETRIVSDVYEDKIPKRFEKGFNRHKFINVLFQGEVYRVLFNPGWVHSEDLDSDVLIVIMDGKLYAMTPLN